MRLAILGSTRGTHLSAIVDAINQTQLSASIEIVISNKADAFILERAKSFGLLATYVDPSGLSREEYDQKISDLLRQHQVDVIVLIGYMRILSANFITQWKHKIINVHPSLLPRHAGLMNLQVHQAVLDAGDKESGCTVHVVTEDVDAGPVMVQKKCVVDASDTAVSLKEKVQKLEGMALVEALQTMSIF